MTDQQSSIEQKIEKDRIDNLFQRSKAASLALFICSTVYISVLTKKIPWQPLLAWYFVLLVVLIGRLLMVRFYEADQGSVKSLSFWLYLFRFGILAAGMTLGSLNVFFFPREPLSLLLMAIILPLGITIGAVTMLFDFFSFFIYVITMMSPIAFQTFLADDRFYSGTGFLACILALFFLKVSREYNSNFLITTDCVTKTRLWWRILKKKKISSTIV